MEKKLVLAYISEWDPSDPTLRSGFPYYVYSYLKKHNFEIKIISPKPKSRTFLNKFKSRILGIIFNKIFKSKFGFYLPNRSEEFLRTFSDGAQKELDKTNYDLIFSPSTLSVAYLKPNKPLVIWVDALFSNHHQYYSNIFHYHSKTIKEGDLAEKNALTNSSMVFLSSQWAIDAALDHYKCPSSKVKLLPLGANFEIKKSFEEIKEIVNKRNRKICKLLFVGAGWERKGGQVVWDVCKELEKAKFPFELHVVGVPSSFFDEIPPWMKVYGFLKKSDKNELNLIKELFEESHFLFVPTRYDAFGHIYAEASSFGLPSLATRTGGVPTAVTDGINGKLFDYNASSKEYKDYIIKGFNNWERYTEFCLKAFNKYEESLNWERIIEKFVNEIQEIIEREKKNG